MDTKSVIEFELNWYEQKIKGLMDLVDSNSPFESIPDRTETEVNAKGVPIIKLVAKKEEMINLIKNILKDLPDMFEKLKALRLEKSLSSKIETKGGRPVSGSMEKFIKGRQEQEKEKEE